MVSPTEAHLRMEVTPYVLGPDGGVRAGVLATVVDVVGGSVRSGRPGAGLDGHRRPRRRRWSGPARGPRIEARASLRRRGRTTLVVEALVFEVPDGAAAGRLGVDDLLPPPREENTAGDEPASVDAVPEMPERWAFTGDGFERPVLDSLGIEVLDAARRAPLDARTSVPPQLVRRRAGWRDGTPGRSRRRRGHARGPRPRRRALRGDRPPGRLSGARS